MLEVAVLALIKLLQNKLISSPDDKVSLKMPYFIIYYIGMWFYLSVTRLLLINLGFSIGYYFNFKQFSFGSLLLSCRELSNPLIKLSKLFVSPFLAIEFKFDDDKLFYDV